jgi:putative ABC transport system substrate-binding protein
MATPSPSFQHDRLRHHAYTVAALDQGDRMKRRSFTMRRRAFMQSATAGLFVPVDTLAQKRRRIGLLNITPRDRLAGLPTWEAFVDALRSSGWSEDSNLEIVVRATGGDARKIPALAEELLSTGIELVVAVDTPSAQALLQRTKTVPIIVVSSADPVAAGLVSSLARPGGNVTGMSNNFNELDGKLLEFSRELVPGLRRLAIVFNPENQLSARSFHIVEALAPSLGIEVIPAPVATPEQLGTTLAALANERAQVLSAHGAQPIGQHSARIAEFAIRHGIVTVGASRSAVLDGFLLFYGPDFVASYRRTAYYVDRILRGSAPSDLPVELATYQLIVNRATARALGLTIPPLILARADEVIE